MRVIIQLKTKSLSDCWDDVTEFEVTDCYVRFIYENRGGDKVENYFMLSELEYFKTVES